ncbi:MAG: glycoside hydrolase family 3 C-terminal domain-containing protein [Lachnospiraceae bacterium]|nr:glycoside hydrolase family 3 C-terminal domain-containing protein [Lachnospiraceae bacterium]
MRTKKIGRCLTAFALSGAMCALPTVTTMAGTMEDGKYFNDYSSYEEAEAAADELNKDLSREGNVLLKNDGTLPLTGDEWISVFGAGSDSLISVREDATNASGTIADSLELAGFNVNPALVRYYGAEGTEIGNETYDFDREVEESLKVYDGAAVVVFTRAAGEGSDTARVLNEEEDNLYGDEEAAFTHKALATGSWEDERFTYDAESDTEYKHYQQLTDSEEMLLKYVESKFDKVIVVLNTANAMEMYNLEQDENINAILQMERPGETGHVAVGEILSGEVNPSGRLVDEWTVDFTSDPTWYNFGNNEQTGSSNIICNEDGEPTGEGQTGPTDPGYYMVDYEEDIYLGYRYYETYYYETYLGNTAASAPEGASEEEKIAAANAWYAKNVLYPFGSGLSYTNFSMNIQGVYTDAECTQSLGESVNQSLFASSENSPAQVETLYIPVDVTNTGDVAGKQVVELYMTAPYSQGGVEKSYMTLAGYAKSSLLEPGKTETVMVSIHVQDFASYDYTNKSGLAENGGYVLESGEYTVHAMSTSHFDLATDISDTSDSYDEQKFMLTDGALLALDDYSHNVVDNLFSTPIEEYCDAAEGEYELYSESIRTPALSADGTSSMTVMSRADLDGTFPTSPTTGDLTVKDDVIANWNYWNTFGWNESQSKQTDYTYSDEGQAWSNVEIPDDWTQAGTTAEVNEILLADMAGIDPYDDSFTLQTTDPASEHYTAVAAFEGKTANEAWQIFMNQLSFEELITIVETGGHSTAEIPSIGKVAGVEADSPNNLSNTHSWCDESTVASTWNVELARKQGIIVGDMAMYKGVNGWWGPGMDTHRSPFSGRNNEYYSQDGIQGGYIAAAVVSGAEARGLKVYIKHFALNDQETSRDGMNNNSFISEQAMRENNLKVFQMAMQEGGAAAAMCAFARISGIPTAVNYDFLVRLADEQWDWNGVFLTDGYMGVASCTTGDYMVRTGCIQLSLGGSTTVSGLWDASLRDGKGAVAVDDVQNDVQYYYIRQFAICLLAEEANSTANENGFTLVSLEGKALEGTQAAEEADTVAFSADVLGTSTAAYTVTDGELPEGVTLGTDGSVTGAPVKAGSYSFEVTAAIDQWVQRSASFTMNVVSAFTTEGDALDGLTAGSVMRSAIVSDTVSVDAGYTSVTYALEEGALPEGVTLNEDGTITGTPAEAGTYDFTVAVNASKQAENQFPGPGAAEETSSVYTYTGTIVVGE